MKRADLRVKYDPSMIPIIKACATFGAIEDEIANYLDVSIASFSRWKLQYPELRDALKRGTEASNDRVEDSLYRLAIGWNGNPPNVTAAIFFLKNRRPDRWRDVQRIEAALGHYVISERPLTEEEWSRDRATIIDGSSPTLPKPQD